MKKIFLLCLWALGAYTQNLTINNYEVQSFTGIQLPPKTPLLSFEINKKPTNTLQSDWKSKFEISFTEEPPFNQSFKAKIVFKNISSDTLNLRNVVPFGISEKEVYITGLGDHWLSRAHLFLPNRTPVNIILPDNAWELGFRQMTMPSGKNIYGITRRKSWEKATRKRFETIVAPQGSVIYEFYADTYEGTWQEALRKAFQEKYIYDVEKFDESLYVREDLKWIRDAYVMHLIMAWDKWMIQTPSLRERGTGGEVYQPYYDFLKKGKPLYGGDDVVGIWPTWPTLGLDQRNQWDMFRDLPGGLSKLNEVAINSRKQGTKFFICYNPWDESTSYQGSAKEGEGGHLNGMAELVKAVGADGVVLDTKGESSRDLQAAADAVRKGVVMYSEGMAVPKNMGGIISGRVHNALEYPPMLNLNKFIKPEFTIFRVAEIFKEPIKREFATSFFNGYGTELNIFRNGKPQEWLDEQYKYLGRTSRILRENSDLFHSKNYIPLIPTSHDKIYVNHWIPSVSVIKTEIYTIFSLIPEGYKNLLFEVQSHENEHFIDLWHHKELKPVLKDGKYCIEAETDAFNASWLGTNNEGEVDCIAKFPNFLKYSYQIHRDILNVSTEKGTSIKIWAGKPSYEKQAFLTFEVGEKKQFETRLFEASAGFEGKIIMQLFDGKTLIDERIFEIPAGTPRLISEVKKTTKNVSSAEMVQVPSGKFLFKTTHGDDFVYYPDSLSGKSYEMKSFLMDKNLVTNADYQSFIKLKNYKPTDAANFLKHLKEGKAKPNEPVVFISYEDAQAYCYAQGKRLPTEQEWQYAAQYPDARAYPWGNTFDSTKVNVGNGKIDVVGKYPNGINALQINDLVGIVWQLTNDIYANGSYQYIMLKGGSYFKPTSSWWYVQGGPQKLTHQQHLLRVSQGFERNATVGFRCVRDLKE